MTNYVEKALKLALEIHAGQVDKAGKPYILHPLRLMLKFSTDDEMITALMHDVVEDGDITLADLEELGFNKYVVSAIDCLTKRDNESYEAFISRINQNSLAKKIKIEDLKDNMDLTRLDSISDKDIARVKKYHKALSVLLAE
jgi:(p)ppGpp synthase/HD superfamily hydrolase